MFEPSLLIGSTSNMQSMVWGKPNVTDTMQRRLKASALIDRGPKGSLTQRTFTATSACDRVQYKYDSSASSECMIATSGKQK